MRILPWLVKLTVCSYLSTVDKLRMSSASMQEREKVLTSQIARDGNNDPLRISTQLWSRELGSEEFYAERASFFSSLNKLEILCDFQCRDRQSSLLLVRQVSAVICRCPSRFDSKKIRLVIKNMHLNLSNHILTEFSDALKASKPDLTFSGLALNSCHF